jgi:subtilase family serine protease
VYCKDPILKGGTSMSTPLVAAIFTRINDERLAVGKSPIGFVNPTLYANPQIFNDITVGDQSLGSCGPNFFSCVEGSSYFQLQNCFSQRSGKLGAISEATAKLSSRNSSLALLTLTPTNFLFTVLTKIDLDPVTGLGTPKYDAWLKVFMALP